MQTVLKTCFGWPASIASYDYRKTANLYDIKTWKWVSTEHNIVENEKKTKEQKGNDENHKESVHEKTGQSQAGGDTAQINNFAQTW